MTKYIIKKICPGTIFIMFLLMLTLLPASRVYAGGDIHVAKSGRDSNAGDESAPFKTIQRALDMAAPGQTIYIHKGTYTGCSRFTNSGEEGAEITLTSYGDGRVRLKGKKVKKAGRCCILDLNGQSFIRIEGLELYSAKAHEAYGILMENGEHNIVISGNRIHHIAALKKKKHRGDANAILCFGNSDTDEGAVHDILIEGNEVYKINPGWSEAVSAAGNVRNIIIKDNRVHDIANIGIDICGNFGYSSEKALDQPRDCEVSGNITYNCKSPYAACAGIYVDGARDILIRDNQSYRNQYGIEIGAEQPVDGYPTEGIEAYGNDIHDNTMCGIRVGGYFDKNIETGHVENSYIHENILRDNTSRRHMYNGEIVIAKCRNITFSDNLICKKKYCTGRGTLYPIIGTDFGNDKDRETYITDFIFYGNRIVRGADGESEAMSDDWRDYLE